MSMCGINLAHMLCPRSEWHLILFPALDLDTEKAAVPAKYFVNNNICNFEDLIRKHITDFTMRVGSSNNIFNRHA